MNHKSAFILSLTVSLFTIQSQAADTLCDVNIQEIDNVLHTAGRNLGDSEVRNLELTKKEAMEANKAGEIEKCISLTQRALSSAENTNMGGGGNK